MNALPALAPDRSCTAELGPRDVYLVDYPAGTVAITGESYGCQPIAGRPGAKEIRARFITAVQAPGGAAASTGSGR